MDELTARPIKCFLLDHGYTTQTSGPCCLIDDFRHLKDSDENKIIKNYAQLHQHPRYIEIKTNMDSGEWDPSCNVCQAAENSNLASMRTSHERYYNDDDNPGLKNLSIWTGRECNLQCRSCSPYCSSSWSREFSSLTNEIKIKTSWDESRSFAIKKSSEYDPDNFQYLTNVILTGGEPLYNKECFPLLEMIGDATNGECSLSFTTNCTIAIDFEKFPFLKKFKKISLTCSIDAIGKEFDFIRTGGRWEKVIDNLRRYRELNIHMTYHITHSALNLFDIVKTRRWLEEHGLVDCGLQTFVRFPDYLGYDIFKQKEKELFLEWCHRQENTADYQYIIDYLFGSSYNQQLRKEFFDFMEHTNRYHGMDWKNYLPNLFNLMNNNQ